MKKLLSIVLALSLAGTSAAFAKGHGSASHYGNYGHSQHYRNGGNGAAAALGFGLLALGVIGAIASQQNRDHGYGYYGPAPAYGYGGYNGYGTYGYQGYPYPASNYGYAPAPYGYPR